MDTSGLWNGPALRREYAVAGSPFRSTGDIEAIVPLYERFGADGGGRLEGMFRPAGWGDRGARPVLARDRAGEKPLFWTELNGELRFASEIQALLVYPDQPRRVNPAAAALYGALGYVPAPHTMLDGISKLAPAHLLVADRKGLAVRRYWDPAAVAARPTTWSPPPPPRSSGRSTSSPARSPSRSATPPSYRRFSWPRRPGSMSKWSSRARARTSCSAAIRRTSATRRRGCIAGSPHERRSAGWATACRPPPARSRSSSCSSNSSPAPTCRSSSVT